MNWIAFFKALVASISALTGVAALVLGLSWSAHNWPFLILGICGVLVVAVFTLIFYGWFNQ